MHSVKPALVEQDGELLRHKVLTGYTIRKQQGGSQLKHLRSGAGAACQPSMPCAKNPVELARVSTHRQNGKYCFGRR